jgi:colanic acid/amylovoran biosynthesis protein
MKNKIRALIINVRSLYNAGDEALLYVTIKELEKYFDIDTITISIDFPPNKHDYKYVHSFTSWIKHKYRYSILKLTYCLLIICIDALFFRIKIDMSFVYPKLLQPLVNSYKSSHIIISKPGGFLYSSGKGASLIVSLLPIFYAKLLNKPLYLLPQSIGPFNCEIEKAVVKYVLNGANLIFTREDISTDQILEIGISSTIVKPATDMAFLYCPDMLRHDQDPLMNIGVSTNRRVLLGVTVIDWSKIDIRFRGQQIYEESILALLSWFSNELRGNVIIIPQVTGPSIKEDDRVPSERIYFEAKKRINKIYLISNLSGVSELVYIYGQLDIFLATRMHSAIFAWSQFIPTLAISYQPKTLGLAKQIEMDKWVIGINEVTPSLLISKFEELWYQREEVKKTLINNLKHAKECAQTVMVEVKNNFAII